MNNLDKILQLSKSNQTDEYIILSQEGGGVEVFKVGVKRNYQQPKSWCT